MRSRTAIYAIGLFMLGAAASIGLHPYSMPWPKRAVADVAKECDVCARRHQRLTRSGNTLKQGRENPLSETVRFSYEVAERSLSLTGRLYRPDTQEPAPAIVLMHGCAGVWSLQREWAERFQSWGYVALVLDSFRPRGVDAICEELDSGAPHQGNELARSFDAYGALGFLSALDSVDPQRIALVGWSHGGGVAQRVATGAAVNTSLIESGGGRFRAIVAFYPWCLAVGSIRIPLLILIGGADDWTPAPRCQGFAAGQELAGDPVEIVVYPNATHSFDGTEIGEGQFEYGHFLRHDPEATTKAVKRVREFFADHLGG